MARPEGTQRADDVAFEPDDTEPLAREHFALITRLSRDLAQAAEEMTAQEARYTVDTYYQLQRNRIALQGRVRAASESSEPNRCFRFIAEGQEIVEANCRLALARYARKQAAGRWALSVVGIGPVLAAGLLAHTHVEHLSTVGHLWRFAGLDPTVTWEKGERRPWNAQLKTLCWKIGESFVKVQYREGDVYGHVYAARKRLEIERNEAGLFAEQAAHMLQTMRFHDDTQAKAHYLNGRLPPAHIHARSKRYAVKLFLSAWHTVVFWIEHGELPPRPYVIEQLGHVDYYGPPGIKEPFPALYQQLREQRATFLDE